MSTEHSTTRQSFSESWEDFLELISGLGAFIPPSFWEILKVARVIFTPGNEVSDALKPSFGALVEGSRDSRDKDLITVEVPVFDHHNPEPVYRRIDGINEIHLVDHTSLALMDMDELMQKAQERQLYVRVMQPQKLMEQQEEIKSVQTSLDGQKLNPAAQKVYILMDISFSMKERSRLVFAKALLLEYLRIKSKGDSQMFFRAFDVTPYEMLHADTRPGYERIMKAILFAEPRAKGTDIQSAILKAAADISKGGMYNEAEIVLVTDGIDRFDRDLIKKALGHTMKLHTFKIGSDSQEPGRAEIKDMMEQDGTLASQEDVTRKFQRHLALMFQEISETFVELPDLHGSFYRLDQDAFQMIRRNVQRLTDSVSLNLTAKERYELYRRAAFLSDFVSWAVSDLEARGAQGGLEELRGMLKRLSEAMSVLLRDREVLLHVIQAGNTHLMSSKEFRQRARQEKLKVKIHDAVRSDRGLRLAIGLRGRGQAQKRLSLFEMLRLLLDALISAFKRKPAKQTDH